MALLTISDLIDIGNLGKKRVKDTGQTELFLNLRPDFAHILPRLDDVFLIFKDHRVRYVKLQIRNAKCEMRNHTRKTKLEIAKVGANYFSPKQSKIIVTFSDPDILEELLCENEVTVALDPDTRDKIDDQSEYYDPVGMKVIWNDEEVATIVDWFFNGAHDVYEIEMSEQFGGRRSECGMRNAKTKADTKQVKQLVLIPDVPQFVIETNIEENYIKVVDLDQFLDI